jgi:ribosome biogenesis protein SSF1/2
MVMSVSFDNIWQFLCPALGDRSHHQSVFKPNQIAVNSSHFRLTEIGPRMALQLVKIEEGVCSGEVLFHEFVTKTEEELNNLKHFREKKR